MNKCSAIRCLVNQRKRIAYRFGNPRIAGIHFHLIRHWFGTVQFHKRPDPDYIARLLGHKNWSSTQIYVNLEKMAFGEGSNDYIVKVASTTEDAQKLMEVGFDYVCTFEGKMMLRKRK